MCAWISFVELKYSQIKINHPKDTPSTKAVISFIGKQMRKYAKVPLGTIFFRWCLLYSQAMPRNFVHPTNTQIDKYKYDLTKVDYLLSIILSKLDLCATTLTNDQQPTTD